jgi:hypothetical protein
MSNWDSEFASRILLLRSPFRLARESEFACDHALIALAYGFAYGATILAHCLDFSE